MKFEQLWERDLHVAVNPHSVCLAETEGAVFLTERASHISKVDLFSGKTLWSQSVPGIWGWTSFADNKLYYASQGEGLFVFDGKSGEDLAQITPSYPFMGYIIVNENIIVTGGWRGYTDLQAYDINTFEKMWSIPLSSPDIQSISIPAFYGPNSLVLAHHGLQEILVINTITGIIENKIEMPHELYCPDLGRSYQTVDEQLVFPATDGALYTLDKQCSHLVCEELDINVMKPAKPMIDRDNIILKQDEDSLSLYNRREKRIQWNFDIAHNPWDEVFAAKLEENTFILAGSYGQLKVISDGKELVTSLKTEKRITTQLLLADNIIIYGTKGAIKAISYTPR